MPKDGTLECENYTVFLNNRQEKHKNARKYSGGVAVLIKSNVMKDFDAKIIDKSVDGLIVLELANKSSDFTIVLFACYLPPENSVWGRDPTSFYAHIISQIYLNQNADAIVLCGDFNSRIGNMSDIVEGVDDIPARRVLDKVKKAPGETFIEFVKDSKLAILNGRVNVEDDNYTFVSSRGKSVVDYFLVPHECLQFCEKFSVQLVSYLIEKSNSENVLGPQCKPPDHSVLTLNMRYSYMPCNEMHNLLNDQCNVTSDSNWHAPDTIPKHVNQRRKMYLFENRPDAFMNSPMWRMAINSIIDRISEEIIEKENMDALYSDMCKAIFEELDTHLEFRYVSKAAKTKLKNHKPYWNSELSEMWKHMTKKEKAFLKYKGHSTTVRSRLRDEFKVAQNQFDKYLRKCARAHAHKEVTEIDELSFKSPNDFWKRMKSLGPLKNRNIPMQVKIDDVVVDDEKIVIEKWRNDFSQLLNDSIHPHFNDDFLNEIIEEKKEREEMMNDPQYDENQYLNRDISVDELITVTNKTQNRKATGIDLIPNEVIKCSEIQSLLHKFFNKCFSTGLFPSLWHQAIIKPIPKGADKDPYLPLNYRGISLLSCVSKTYSSILNNRLVSYMEESGMFPEEQNGFRKGRSCQDHIFSLTSIIKNRISRNRDTFCAFVDLEKAFDWVNRDLLLYSLIVNNVDGKFYNNVKTLLTNTSSCIALSNCIRTDWFDVNCGVRQGDSMSPTLFSIYINDIVQHLKTHCPTINIGDTEINCLLYADDMVLIAEDENSLQCMLNEVYNWCIHWRLNVNESKTKVVHFRNSRKLQTDFKFMYGDNELDNVKHYKYLGIILDEHLTFNECVETLADSAGRALGGVIAKFKSMKNVGYQTFTKLFTSGVQPVYEYGAEVWGFNKAYAIDKVQTRAIRYYLGLHKFTPNAALTSEMGWLKPNVGRFLCIFRFWNRLLRLPCTSICKQIFEKDFELCNKNWCYEFKCLCETLDITAIYINKEVVDLNIVRDKLKEVMISNWRDEVNSKPKLRTYVYIKDNVEVENYVKYCYNRQNRSLLAQLRCGTLPLKIETGRFTKLAVEDRVCIMCNLGKVEDEVHFVVECPFYVAERNILFNAVNISSDISNLTNLEIFAHLLKHEWREVIKYLNTSWKKRQLFLFK